MALPVHVAPALALEVICFIIVAMVGGGRRLLFFLFRLFRRLWQVTSFALWWQIGLLSVPILYLLIIVFYVVVPADILHVYVIRVLSAPVHDLQRLLY